MEQKLGSIEIPTRLIRSFFSTSDQSVLRHMNGPDSQGCTPFGGKLHYGLSYTQADTATDRFEHNNMFERTHQTLPSLSCVIRLRWDEPGARWTLNFARLCHCWSLRQAATTQPLRQLSTLSGLKPKPSPHPHPLTPNNNSPIKLNNCITRQI